jgi:hypothetical protein
VAQKVLVQLVDDLDGTATDDIETVAFSLDGVNYEIDLGDFNSERLREALGVYISAARRTGGRQRRGTGVKALAAVVEAPVVKAAPAADREQTKAIRAWAQNQGYEVSARGRIPANIIEEFEEAHAPKATAPAKKKPGRPRKAATPAFSG